MKLIREVHSVLAGERVHRSAAPGAGVVDKKKNPLFFCFFFCSRRTPPMSDQCDREGKSLSNGWVNYDLGEAGQYGQAHINPPAHEPIGSYA